MKSIIAFLFQIYFIKKVILKKIIKIPFKRKLELVLNETNIMENLLENKIYTEIEIGNPPQKLNMYFKLQQFPTFFVSEDYKNSKCEKFNQNISKTFKVINQKLVYITFINLHFKHGMLVQDNFSLNNKQIFFENFSFVLAKDLIDEAKFFSGEFGLKISNRKCLNLNDSANIIKQLIENKFIDSYIFYLQFSEKNNDEGEIIFGDYCHNIDKKYSEKNFIYFKMPLIEEELLWSMNHNFIYLNNEKLFDDTIFISFQYEFGLIQLDNNYYNKIKTNFFDKFINQCFEKEFSINYPLTKKTFISFFCDNNINLQSFPDLVIENLDAKYNFTLTYKDLFYDFNGIKYFLIVFKKTSQYEKSDIILGKPFFKKYLFVFDGENKIIGFYDKNIGKFIFPLSWIFVFILFILLIITIVYFKFFENINKRKLRANELEDNYDYITQNDNNNNILNN